MSPYPFNANRTPRRLLTTRVGIVPQYVKKEMEKILSFQASKSPADAKPQKPQHSKDKVEPNDQPGAKTDGFNANDPFLQPIAKNEKVQVRKRVDEWYASQLEKLKKEQVVSPPPTDEIALEHYLCEELVTMIQNTEALIFMARTVHMLAESAIDINAIYQREYGKLQKMCLAVPSLEPRVILNQMRDIETLTTLMELAKRTLQDEHRFLTDKLQSYDLQRMNQIDPPAESENMEDVRSTWSNVFHMLNLYTKEESQ